MKQPNKPENERGGKDWTIKKRRGGNPGIKIAENARKKKGVEVFLAGKQKKDLDKKEGTKGEDEETGKKGVHEPPRGDTTWTVTPPKGKKTSNARAWGGGGRGRCHDLKVGNKNRKRLEKSKNGALAGGEGKKNPHLMGSLGGQGGQSGSRKAKIDKVGIPLKNREKREGPKGIDLKWKKTNAEKLKKKKKTIANRLGKNDEGRERPSHRRKEVGWHERGKGGTGGNENPRNLSRRTGKGGRDRRGGGANTGHGGGGEGGKGEPNYGKRSKKSKEQGNGFFGRKKKRRKKPPTWHKRKQRGEGRENETTEEEGTQNKYTKKRGTNEFARKDEENTKQQRLKEGKKRDRQSEKVKRRTASGNENPSQRPNGV